MAKIIHVLYTRLWFTSDEELNSSDFLYLFLKLVTLLHKVWCIPVKDMDIGWVNVNVVEQVLEHVGMVALRVVPRDPNVLVHVKRDHMLE